MALSSLSSPWRPLLAAAVAAPRRLSMLGGSDEWPLLGKHNSQLKLLRTLRQRKHREREGLIVLVSTAL